MFDRHVGHVIGEGMKKSLENRRKAEANKRQRKADSERNEVFDKIVEQRDSLNYELMRLLEEVRTDANNLKMFKRRAGLICDHAAKEKALQLSIREKRALNLLTIVKAEMEMFCATWDLDFQLWLHNKLGSGRGGSKFSQPSTQETKEAFDLNSLYVSLKCLPPKEIDETRNAWVASRVKEYEAMELNYPDRSATVPDDDRFGRLPSAKFYELMPEKENSEYTLKNRSMVNVLGLELVRKQLV